MTGLSLLVLPTSCMQEFEPQGGSVTSDQAVAPREHTKTLWLPSLRQYPANSRSPVPVISSLMTSAIQDSI